MAEETTQAANALIEWFNSQEIGASQSLEVMQKVIAKVLIAKASDTIAMRRKYDGFVSDLANRMNDRAFQIIHGKRK